MVALFTTAMVVVEVVMWFMSEIGEQLVEETVRLAQNWELLLRGCAIVVDVVAAVVYWYAAAELRRGRVGRDEGAFAAIRIGIVKGNLQQLVGK